MNNKLKMFLIILGSTVILSLAARAQEYKLAKSTGRLVITEVNDVTIEGYDGNEIIFTAKDYSREKDERAEGLRAINGMGLSDNTGIGLSVVENGNAIEVRQLRKMDGPDINIRVPKGVTISYMHSSPHGDDISVINVGGEIEISTVHNGVKLVNVTGPVILNTVHGEIEADFTTAMKSPVSMVSVHGLIDVTLPAAIGATLAISTNHGEILVDPAIKIELDKKDEEWVRFGTGNVTGKINGGGIDIKLSSSTGNIYLRKK